MKTLIISGDTPSLKNSKQIFRGKGGRPFITASNASKQWRLRAVAELLEQSSGDEHSYPLTVIITFYRSTRRRSDLDNMAAGCLDALVEAGIIEDDSYNHINKLVLLYGGLDKENPRAEINISKSLTF